MRTHDSLGRALPSHNILTDNSVTILDADVYGVMEPLNIHGPLYTQYLVEFQYFYRDNLRNRRERLSTLARSKNIRYEGGVGGPVLERPKRQFPKEFDRPYLRRMMLRYDLTERGKEILRHADRYHPVPHGGWWEHQTANACISASLHLAALHQQVRFYAPDQITDDIGRIVPYTLHDNRYEHRLVPDCLCGIGERYYAIETDLGNEVGRSGEHRKTYERMVAQYKTLIGDGLYHEAYKIPANMPLLVLFLSTSAPKLKLLKDIVSEQKAGGYILMKHINEDAFNAYRSPMPLYTLWTDPWGRAGYGDFQINNPAKQ